MEQSFREITAVITLLFEALAAIIISFGGIIALYRLLQLGLKGTFKLRLRAVWLEFAGWILLGLEFMMAGDVISTMVSPSWETVGLLACIVFIRTFLSFFIERDFEIARKNSEEVL